MTYVFDITSCASKSIDTGVTRVEREFAKRARLHVKRIDFVYLCRRTCLLRVIKQDIVDKILYNNYVIDNPKPKYFWKNNLRDNFDLLRMRKPNICFYKKKEIHHVNDFSTKLYTEQRVNFINVGASWRSSIINYINNLKELNLIKDHIFLCHDIIPNLYPNLFTSKNLAEDVLKAIKSSDLCLISSDLMANDLAKICVREGLETPTTHKIKFGQTLKSEKNTGTINPVIAREQKYILYVSTIEIRKNHTLLYEAWKQLCALHPSNDIKVVLVGKKGWLVDELWQKLHTDPFAKKNFIVLNSVSDTQLDWLYTNCLFTVYPSFYEGYGLPVVESLSHNKVCITSNGGSLPEIGQGLTFNLDPYDVHEWTQVILRLATDVHKRTRLENEIKQRFTPITWDDAAAYLFEIINKFTHDQNLHSS